MERSRFEPQLISFDFFMIIESCITDFTKFEFHFGNLYKEILINEK